MTVVSARSAFDNDDFYESKVTRLTCVMSVILLALEPLVGLCYIIALVPSLVAVADDNCLFVNSPTVSRLLLDNITVWWPHSFAYCFSCQCLDLFACCIVERGQRRRHA